MSDITTADSAGEFRLQVHIDNSASNVLNINGFDGGVGQGSIVFNEDSKDFDFRVESDNNANAFLLKVVQAILQSVRPLLHHFFMLQVQQQMDIL